MFRLRKKFRFEAAHQLPDHDGKCQRLHGHSWIGEIVVEGVDSQLITSGAKAGMLIDYGDLGAAIQPLLEDHLDHWFLNESTGLKNPSSEEIARWVYERLKPDLPLLVMVAIEETCTCRAEYAPDLLEEEQPTKLQYPLRWSQDK